jgi:glutamate racemase
MEFDGPTLGVIVPGTETAVRQTKAGRIGVIGTPATIGSGAYEKAIRERLPEARVFSTACPLFVPLAEERMESHAATRLIAQEYLQPLLDQQIDTLILGCTHYPLLKATLQDVVGPEITVVDSAESTAQAAAQLLDRLGLRSDGKAELSARFFVSDDPSGLEKMHRRLMPNDPMWVGTAQPTPI